MANRYSQPALTSAEALASAAPDALDDDRRERQDARDKAPEESNSPQGVFEGGEAAARVSRKSPREFAADAELSRSRDASSGRNDNDESAENQGNLAAQASSHEDPAAALCRDWRTPHAFLSKAATAESLRIPPKLDLTAALMPFYFYGHDKRGNYILVTKFSDFNVPMIRRQLSDLDIRSFFRFKNLAWFGRIAPSPTASSIVVSDAAGTDIARVVLQGGILVAKSYVQAMTSTIPDVGVRVSEIHIMNVPRAAAFLLGIVRALSPKEIQFFTYASRQEFLDKMGDVIGLENLPTHFGGTNAVPIHISELEACFDEFVREARAAEVERRLKELERQEEKERQEMERQFHFLFD
ncbi:hypothetical protein BESB_080620 [Besnoitia besnoiti]|uniref:CRAL-TRIO domain-containing protein n=1 Tax=Besnoitia besnoiti TaxID=94643 RepID=A0A2A9MD20_BESBE|nr:hypothetical protein BESB_080620 [Besnoitia besnoiti]PFH33846.1 hypothetical protein BESB_080620 [Besnoitia besnoiti]